MADDDPRRDEKEQAEILLGILAKAFDDLDEEKITDEEGDDIGEKLDSLHLSIEVVRQVQITTCTGGPAIRVVAEIDAEGDAKVAHLEHQGWGTPWTRYPVTRVQQEVLDRFVDRFSGNWGPWEEGDR